MAPMRGSVYKSTVGSSPGTLGGRTRAPVGHGSAPPTLGVVPRIVRPGQVTINFTDDGAGTPLFLHTGSGGDGSMWKRAGYYDSLGLRRYLAVDHRGHGRSTTPEDVEGFRPEELVADVVAVLDDAKVERAVFVGYSAGAAVLCRAAGAHPQRCLGFIGLGFCPEASDTDEENPWPRRVRELGVRKVIEQMARAESETPPAWFVENLCETSDDAFALPIVAAQHAPPLWEALADVTVPTLLICGSEEVDAVSLRSAERRVPDGSSARLEGYGHLQVFWHADVTGTVIAKWLDENDW
jgi:pimeloyl-ACP methyl ester carboxylesterase